MRQAYNFGGKRRTYDHVLITCIVDQNNQGTRPNAMPTPSAAPTSEKPQCPDGTAGLPPEARFAVQKLTPETYALLERFQLTSVVSHLLRRAHFLAEDMFSREFPNESLTPRQKAALIVVYQQPGLNQNALADRLFMDRNTIAGMVKRLVAANLLLRRAAQNDHRAYQLYLAPSGAQLLNRVLPRDAQIEAHLLERLPEEYRPLFLKCLKVLVDAAPPPTI